jgi:hypothetical protein
VVSAAGVSMKRYDRVFRQGSMTLAGSPSRLVSLYLIFTPRRPSRAKRLIEGDVVAQAVVAAPCRQLAVALDVDLERFGTAAENPVGSALPAG